MSTAQASRGQTPDQSAAHKLAAARKALEFVTGGMVLGLGSGSTAHEFVRLLAAGGPPVTAVAASRSTGRLAGSLGLNPVGLDDVLHRGRIDLTVDGADELTADLALIKGGGGDLLGEKIVAAASREVLIIAEERKLVQTLGAFALPVEITQFGARTVMRGIADVTGKLKETGELESALEDGDMTLRPGADGGLFLTDQENLICDCRFGVIPRPAVLNAFLRSVPGVVDCGLFIGMARRAVLAGDGGVRVLEP